MTFERAKHLVTLLRKEPECPKCGEPAQTFKIRAQLANIKWYVMYRCGSSWDNTKEFTQVCKRGEK